MMFSKFYIEKIVRESTTIKSFYLVSRDKRTLSKYVPGQFVTVRVKLKNNEIVTRNYTLSAAPNENYRRLTIKREANGLVSQFSHDELVVGSEVELSDPMGNFHLNTETENPIVLISGGVGITPMMSMIEFVVRNQLNRTVHFLHSSLDSDVQPFKDRLNELKTSNHNLTISIFHSTPLEKEEAGLDFDFKGFIDKEALRQAVNSECDYFLCGPEGFMNAMYDHLLDLEVKEEKILYEFFGEGKKLGSIAQNVDTEESAIKVLFSNSGVETLWDSSMNSILDLAESNGIETPSSCRMGTCATCESQLLSGDIAYDPEPFMPVSAEDKIFICCAKPVTDVNFNI